MSEPIHAHALFDMIDAHADGIAVADLKEQATQHYGEDVTFANCAGTTFTFDEIVAFFHQRNKVIEIDGKLQLNKGNICQH